MTQRLGPLGHGIAQEGEHQALLPQQRAVGGIARGAPTPAVYEADALWKVDTPVQQHEGEPVGAKKFCPARQHHEIAQKREEKAAPNEGPSRGGIHGGNGRAAGVGTSSRISRSWFSALSGVAVMWAKDWPGSDSTWVTRATG